jgi:hypothetical protein
VLARQRFDLVVQLRNTGQQRPDLRDTASGDGHFPFKQGGILHRRRGLIDGLDALGNE